MKLDTPQKQTLHWLDNSILHNNGNIFVTFQHHEVIRQALIEADKGQAK